MKTIYWSFAVIFLFVSAARADVVNGDFETGTFTPWDAFGVVAVQSDAALRNVNGTGNFPSGIFVALFGGGNGATSGVILQDVATVPGLNYTVSFGYGKFNVDPGIQSIHARAYNSSTNVTLGQLDVADSVSKTNLATLLQPHNFAFTANAALTRISFADTSPVTNGQDGVLDNIHVVAVPEPSTLVLAAVGGSLLLLRVNRRRGRAGSPAA